MKKLLLSALVLLTMTCAGFAQNLPSYVPANGLVGWWPFNGNANDESGNGNNGTVNGATLTTDRFGNAGKAYQFDGLDDFIEVLHSSSLSLPNGTINLWFKTGSNGRMTLFNKADFSSAENENFSCTIGYLFVSGLTGIGYFSKYNSTCTPSVGWIGPDNSLNFSDNNFHMLTCTTGPNSISIYIDAVQQTSIPAPSISADLCPGSSLFFGVNWAGDLNPFLGTLDDIAIYNRALTQQEITALYQGGNTTANCLDLPSNLQQGLVGYWPFCGNALDESGNGNNGTVNGATLTTDRFGNPDKAYRFDGVNDLISIPDNSSLQFGNKLTVSVWHQNDTARYYSWFQSFNGTMVSKITGNTSNGFWLAASSSLNPSTLYCDGTGLRLKSYGLMGDNINQNFGTNSSNVDCLEPNIWECLTFVFDEGMIKTYIDSKKVDSITAPFNVVTNNNVPLIFGYMHNAVGPFYFHGSLDDIAIWNRALSQEEITQLYNQGICKTSITVTDTLLIHTGITAYNPVAYQNTLKVWPNPGNQDITLDAGNLASMQGWKYKVANTLGQTVVNETAISQQQTFIDLSTWGGNGIYYLHLINPQGHAIEIKKIVLAP